jgi:arylsulfatase A-like enzyme
MQVMPNTREFFGREGTEFANGYVAEPFCCPSRASIFSGKYPHNHGITSNDGTAFDADDTWQRRLHELGYYTGIIGKYLNGVQTSRAPHFDFRQPISPYNAVDEQAQLKDLSSRFLDQAEAGDGQPWALVYSTQSPHFPWNVKPTTPQPLPDFDPRPPSLDETDLADKHPAVAAVAAAEPTGSQPIYDTEVQREGMLTELQATDEGLGSLFAKLDQQDERQGTLAFYISDNGTLWGQHRIHHKLWPYQEAVKVPFYASWPGHVQEGAVSRDLVANIDIAPAIYEATGATAGYELDGQPLFSSAPRTGLLLEMPTAQGGMPAWQSYVKPGRQYIRWSDGFVEDYNLAADPWQMSASNQPDAQIEAELDAAGTCVGQACP